MTEDGLTRTLPEDADDMAAHELRSLLARTQEGFVLAPDACSSLEELSGTDLPEPMWGLACYEDLAYLQRLAGEVGSTAVVATTGCCDRRSLAYLGIDATPEIACDRALRAARSGSPRFVLADIQACPFEGDGRVGSIRESVADEVTLLARLGAHGLYVRMGESPDLAAEVLRGVGDASSRLTVPRPLVVDISGSVDIADALDAIRESEAQPEVAAILVGAMPDGRGKAERLAREAMPGVRLGVVVEGGAAWPQVELGNALVRFCGRDAMRMTAVAAAELAA